MLRAGTGVDGDARGDELGKAADKILQHGGGTDDDVADGEHGAAFKKTGQEAVDHLQTLADETRQRRDEAQADQAEAELGHHHRKDHRGDAVLEMIQNMAAADQAEGHALLPNRRFQSGNGAWRCGFGGGGGWIAHGFEHPGVMECWVLSIRLRRDLSNALELFRVRTQSSALISQHLVAPVAHPPAWRSP